MQRFEDDLTLVIEELDALAEVIIPAIDLNDIRRERDEYLAQTASDLYDRVVYMVRSAEMAEGDKPEVKISLQARGGYASRVIWLPTRRERQEWLKKTIVELFDAVTGSR
jgi:hypothetical protein